MPAGERHRASYMMVPGPAALVTVTHGRASAAARLLLATLVWALHAAHMATGSVVHDPVASQGVWDSGAGAGSRARKRVPAQRAVPSFHRTHARTPTCAHVPWCHIRP